MAKVLRFSLGLAFCLLVVSILPSRPKSPEIPQLIRSQWPAPRLRIKSTEQAFVTLHITIELTKHAQCSGFIMQLHPNEKPYVITANHCVDVNGAEVVFFDGSSRHFDFISHGDDEANGEDWAILEGDTQNILPLQPADKDVHFPIITLYVGRDQYIMPVLVSGYEGEMDSFIIIGRVQPGDSGGALLSEDGKVLGIIHSSAPIDDLGFAGPIWNIHFNLPKNPNPSQRN